MVGWDQRNSCYFSTEKQTNARAFLNSGQGTARKKKKKKKNASLSYSSKFGRADGSNLLNNRPPGGTPQGGVLSPPAVQNPSNNKRCTTHRSATKKESKEKERTALKTHCQWRDYRQQTPELRSTDRALLLNSGRRPLPPYTVNLFHAVPRRRRTPGLTVLAADPPAFARAPLKDSTGASGSKAAETLGVQSVAQRRLRDGGRPSRFSLRVTLRQRFLLFGPRSRLPRYLSPLNAIDSARTLYCASVTTFSTDGVAVN